jgi:DivIVA domain-containing protein
VADFILTVIAALVVAGLGFGLFTFISGRDPGLADPDPDGVSVPLPADRLLTSADLESARFDVVLRGYRMDQVDALVAGAARTIREMEERLRDLEAGVPETSAGDPAR